MKVKVGSKVFDGDKEPVMVMFTATDKRNIARMPFDSTKYCVYPDNFDQEEIERWMNKDDDSKWKRLCSRWQKWLARIRSW